jgi:Ca-activated chloride channel homolog
MQVTYALSRPIIPVGESVSLDLLIDFNATQGGEIATRRPLNLSLAIDRSGSMGGTPLRYAIKAAQQLVDQLTPEDYLSVVIYDDDAELILPHQLVTDRAAIKKLIGNIRAGGCTNLSGGWLLACEQIRAKQSPDKLNRVLLLTDGQANMGIVDPQILINTAKAQAAAGIITTTLGFGDHFNEDLLIGIANAGEGNFYFIQSPDDAAEVFRIELETLLAVVGQNLAVTLVPSSGIKFGSLLNNYRSQLKGEQLEIYLGDVYSNESRQIAIAVTIPAQAQVGDLPLAEVNYRYQGIENQAIKSFSDQLPISVKVDVAAIAQSATPDPQTLEQLSKYRIATVKEQAVALADQGDFATAVDRLNTAISDIKRLFTIESFKVLEEISQLEHYAQQLDRRDFNPAIRKEMRDQAYQAQTRDREDLKLRGVASGSADSLEAVDQPDGGVLVECLREGGKLRVRVLSDGYDTTLNVQFPRSIREEGVKYVVDEIELSTDGTFYRANSKIRLLLLPGEERRRTTTSYQTHSGTKKSAANAIGSAADLPTIDSVGNGVLIQCVKDKGKLRARVVSDGYNPNFNMRFPRNIREEGMLFVVDSVEEIASGGSYIAYGKIHRLVQ